MTDGWTTAKESPRTAQSDAYERQLALVDRILGLEAQVAELSIAFDLAPSETLRAEQQIDRMRASLGWRVGRVISAPALVARRRLRRVGRS